MSHPERTVKRVKLTNIFYTVIGWLNFPSTSTPLGQRNLRHMDNGILQCAQYILALSQDKLEASEAAKFVTKFEIDTSKESEWVAIVTHKDGTQEQFDFPIEMMPTKFDLDDDGNLVIVQQDGTTKKVNFQRFVYKFENTATIAMHTNGTTITADVIDGSITMDKLEKSIMQTLRQYMLDAQAAATEAGRYNTASESFAHGGTGERPGEDTDNSKYYSEQAEKEYQRAKDEADRAGIYANFIEPEFILVDNRIYIKESKTVQFVLYGNQLYYKLPA